MPRITIEEFNKQEQKKAFDKLMNTIIIPRKDAGKKERKICSSPMTQESDLNKLEKGTYKNQETLYE